MVTDSIPPKKYVRPPLYACWVNMRTRCAKPWHPAYKWYGARGITVCERWQSFDAFSADMAPTYRAGLQLDRLNNDDGYSPENCCWVTSKQNNRNRRDTRMIETPDGVMSLAAAAEKYGIQRDVVKYRVDRGYAVADVFSALDFRKKA